MQVQDLASIVLKNCGGATDQELSLDLVVEGIISAFEHYMRQLNASSQNQTGATFTWNPSQKIEAVPGSAGENFSRPAYVERLIDASSETYEPVTITGWEDIGAAEANGEFAVAFIGNNPVMGRFSWDVASDAPTLRVLADTDPIPLAGMSDAPAAIPPRFHQMLADHCLINVALPHLLLGEEKAKRYGAFVNAQMPIAMNRLREAETDWDFFRFENTEQGAATIRPFNASRRGRSIGSRMSTN